jgi:hypothetical protein
MPRVPELLHFFYTFQSDGLVAGGTGWAWTGRANGFEIDRRGVRPRPFSTRRSTFERMVRTLRDAAPDAQRMLGFRP